MQRFWLGIFALFIVTISVVTVRIPSACAEDAAENAKVPLRVGVILGLSGEQQLFGVACRNAIEMAMSELPPSEQSRIKLVFEDDRFKASETVVAFNKLSSMPEPERIKAVITFGSSTSKAIATLADEAQIPQLAIATDTRVSQGRNYVLNFWVTAQELVHVLVKEMHRRNYKRIARIGTIHDFTEKLNQSFDTQASNSIEIGLEDSYPIEARDFRPFIIKAKATRGLDAVLVTLLPPQVGLFAKQAKQLGLSLPLTGIEVFEDAGEVKSSDGALIGQWYVNSDEPSDDFAKRYADRFPGAPTFASGTCFDALGVIAAAIRQNPSDPQINTFLHTFKSYRGAMGEFSAQPHNTFSFRGVVKEVTDAGFRRVQAADASTAAALTTAGNTATSAAPSEAEQQCRNDGGTWGRWGLAPDPSCRKRTADAGKPCTSSAQCSTRCVSDSSNSQATGSFATGHCYEWNIMAGFSGDIIEGGRVQSQLIAD